MLALLSATATRYRKYTEISSLRSVIITQSFVDYTPMALEIQVASAIVYETVTNSTRLWNMASIFCAELYAILLAMIIIHRTEQQQQPFYGPLSGTTRMSQYQKKHSPTHHPDHPVFISFFRLPQSIASSLF